MPQATDELRGLMEKWFGNAIDDGPPMRFLESRGYVLKKDWCWLLPTPAHTVKREELMCLSFLQQEWDMGHICAAAHPTYQYERQGT